jgi:hypothetical protein
LPVDHGEESLVPIRCPSNGLELKAEVEGHHKRYDGINRELVRIDTVTVRRVGEGFGRDGVVAVKDEHDPNNVFRFNQNITPSGG